MIFAAKSQSILTSLAVDRAFGAREFALLIFSLPKLKVAGSNLVARSNSAEKSLFALPHYLLITNYNLPLRRSKIGFTPSRLYSHALSEPSPFSLNRVDSLSFISLISGKVEVHSKRLKTPWDHFDPGRI